MATSNYDEVVKDAIANMTGDTSRRTKPRGPIPLGVLNAYFGFVGFGVGVMVGLLTGRPTLLMGVAGIFLAIACVILVRKLRPAQASQVAELQHDTHALEQEAVRLEAEVARQSGAFDKWEQK